MNYKIIENQSKKILNKEIKVNIEYKRIDKEDYPLFHELLTEYYRKAEDADTPQTILDEFIQQLFDMVMDHLIQGSLIKSNMELAGFVLWMIDKKDSNFSQIPGYGVILEIGTRQAYRNKGIGKLIVKYAEEQMIEAKAVGLYVTSCGLASAFWEKCGYANTYKNAFNNLPIYIKSI